MGGIVWLASYPKSGNTWVRAFLANAVSGKSEPLLLKEISNTVPGEASSKWYQRFGPTDLDLKDDEAVANARCAVQAQIAAHATGAIFLKTHSYLGECYGNPTINMDVTIGAIYIVRNPLDVAVSARHHFDVSQDETIDIMAKQNAMGGPSESLVFEKATDWSTHVESWAGRPNPKLLVLRYEDLLDNSQQNFGRLIKFLGLRVPESRIESAIRFTSFKSLKTAEAAQGFSEKPDHTKAFFRKGQAGQWREVLTDTQISRIVEKHRQQMARFGYIPDGY